METIFRIRFRAEANFAELKKGEIIEVFEDIFDTENKDLGYSYTGAPRGFSLVSCDAWTGFRDSLGNRIYENDNILTRYLGVDYKLYMKLERVRWNPVNLQFFCGDYPLFRYQELKRLNIISNITKDTLKEIQKIIGHDFSNEDLTHLICPFEVMGNIYDLSKEVDGKEDNFYLPPSKKIRNPKKSETYDPVN
jgi:hypothetical protein